MLTQHSSSTAQAQMLHLLNYIFFLAKCVVVRENCEIAHMHDKVIDQHQLANIHATTLSHHITIFGCTFIKLDRQLKMTTKQRQRTNK